MKLHIMKIENVLCIIALIGAFTIGTISCSDKNDDEAASSTETTDSTSTVNTWIESIMRENYYWYSEIPEESSLDFTTEPETFFESLLSSSDGKDYTYNSTTQHYYYSYIEDTSSSSTRSISQIDYSYGFDFTVYNIVDENGNSLGYYYAHILYVAPDSPASEAGLERGNWIYAMGGSNITSSNYTTLYGGSATTFSIATYDSDEDGLVAQGTVNISSARTIEDDPVYFDSIYTVGSNKVGYLVYNHFDFGQTDDDDTYNDELLTLSKKFSGVDSFILDLRYNNGGYISCAQLLSTILAPSSALGKTFCTLEFNDKQSSQTETLKYSSSLVKNGANLNLSTVYVLVTDMTASASELVINCLKPYANVVVIGTTTEGKNVGSQTYTDDAYTWALHPIVCKIYNANNESNYTSGFTPDYECDETDYLDKFLAFGNTNESLLNTALEVIAGTYSASTRSLKRTSSLKLTKIACSLDRKATNGVVLNGLQ
ncbi:MAG: peptidase [Bacteroidetes bacterium]|jgi:carboxyl-terminal processing protease|nr:peptidase [Bacteroidota bacterium]